MTIAPIPICESCARPGPGPDGSGMACAAFPDGIPDAIVIDGLDHRQPVEGDNGIRWVLSDEPGATDRLAAYEDSMESAAG